jgi:hypothetical protein
MDHHSNGLWKSQVSGKLPGLRVEGLRFLGVGEGHGALSYR